MSESKCGRCHNPCEPSEALPFMRSVVVRYLSSKQMGELSDALSQLCRACYAVHSDMLGQLKRIEAWEETAAKCVESYEGWCEEYKRSPRMVEKPMDPRSFFNPRTFQAYRSRIDNAIRRMNQGGAGGDM